MPRGSKELTKSRREEIISACEELYKTMSFKEITIKEIGSITSFTRTSIYNYFQTKEEIFLALLKKEYCLWIEALEKIKRDNEKMTRLEFAEEFAHSLDERHRLLKLLSMNHYDMEENSRMECLVDFKVTYGKTLAEVDSCLEKFFRDMSKEERHNFIFSFFPFMFGIYPYTVVTDKQKEAMERAKVDYVYMSVYEITLAEVKKLLNI